MPPLSHYYEAKKKYFKWRFCVTWLSNSLHKQLNLHTDAQNLKTDTQFSPHNLSLFSLSLSLFLTVLSLSLSFSQSLSVSLSRSVGLSLRALPPPPSFLTLYSLSLSLSSPLSLLTLSWSLSPSLSLSLSHLSLSLSLSLSLVQWVSHWELYLPLPPFSHCTLSLSIWSSGFTGEVFSFGSSVISDRHIRTSAVSGWTPH